MLGLCVEESINIPLSNLDGCIFWKSDRQAGSDMQVALRQQDYCGVHHLHTRSSGQEPEAMLHKVLDSLTVSIEDLSCRLD